MGKIIDITGQRFGRLVVVQALGLDRHFKMKWRCQCDCGGSTITSITTLRRGGSQSCGCLQKERASAANRTHGEGGKTPEHIAWSIMNRRCYSKNTLDYPNYGGRGIEVCLKWRASYLAFLADVGRRPSPKHTIDRIDNDRNYEPGNVRWVTRQVQNRNKRNNVYLEFKGERLPLWAWAERLGVKPATLYMRRHRGWSDERIITG